jgi:hypothetical protein
MEDTRVRILEELEAWAQNGTASKVCWLNRHPGTRKITIAHTLCERLEKQMKLGASFFCSRSGLRDAARIIPTISAMLSQSIPKFRLAKNKILESNPDMVNPSSIPEQFRYLVVKHLKLSMDNESSIYNVILIDAIDECSMSWKVEFPACYGLRGPLPRGDGCTASTSSPELLTTDASHFHAVLSLITADLLIARIDQCMGQCTVAPG